MQQAIQAYYEVLQRYSGLDVTHAGPIRIGSP
jgi:hypothetical protein